MCASTSAFAETRHRDATDSSNDSWRAQRAEHRDGAQAQSQQDQGRNDRRTDQNQNRNDRSTARGDQYQDPNDRSASRNDPYQYRNDQRSTGRVESDRRYGRGGSYDNGRRYSSHGRVTRVERHGGGYRVWLGGGYPFFVPEARWRLFPLRVGIDAVLGGVWNQGGYYYDAYDYNGPYGYNTSGDLRGVVESVDYRRGTLVLRDDISGNFVTTVLRGNDPRLGDLRPGDYVDLTGEWSRGGVFDAFNVADIRDSGRYDDDYDGDYDGDGR